MTDEQEIQNARSYLAATRKHYEKLLATAAGAELDLRSIAWRIACGEEGVSTPDYCRQMARRDGLQQHVNIQADIIRTIEARLEKVTP
ncbi:MAG: hypothetical protein GY851_10565 [bacterium]|nr:hypothetical protein [bacterium]